MAHVDERNAVALFAALQALRDDPESRDRVVQLGDEQVRVEHSPEPGVRFRLTPMDSSGESGRWVVRSFDSADSRPGTYPHQLPFLAGIPVLVTEPTPPKLMTAVWNNAPEPQALLVSLVKASRGQGWTGDSPMALESLSPQFISFSQGRARRLIAFVSTEGQSILTVSDSVAD